MPFTTAGALLTALSMGGIPPLFGFIGKEVTYEAALHAGAWTPWLLGASILANGALVAAGLLLAIRPFFGEMKGAFTREPHEAPVGMWLGPLVLGGLGAAFGLVPGLIDHSLLQSAQAGILQESHELHLALWHGVNPAFIASLGTFALGGALYAFWDRLQPSAFMRGLGTAFGRGPGGAFERGLYGLVQASDAAARRLQNGKFRTYLRAIFAAILVLVGGAVLAEATVTWPTEIGPIEFYEAALAGILVVSALAAVQAQDRFIAILALSIGGYGVALIYLLFGAPDLAMTQFSVETLTLILLVIVFIHLPDIQGTDPLRTRLRDAALCVGVGGLMTVVTGVMLSIPLDLDVSRYLTENSYTAAQGYNIVNVILVDFRGLDTMGEITVLTMAALGVYVLTQMPSLDRFPSDGSEEPDAAPVEDVPGMLAAGDGAPGESPAGDGAAGDGTAEEAGRGDGAARERPAPDEAAPDETDPESSGDAPPGSS
jgi:multicomponent Na+:H+ antiporter subunit A